MALICTNIARKDRDVAQLVAHYVRDVGVGRSSRLIPTSKETVVCSAVSFLFPVENPDADEQIARQTHNGRHRNSSGGKDVGIERLFGTAGTSHQDVACDNECACCQKDVTTGDGETAGMVTLVGIV